MSSSIKSLNQALAFQLEGVYEMVKQMQNNLSKASKFIDDQEIRMVFNEYRRSLGDQRLKLKRIFSYLLSGPYGRKAMREFAPWDDIINKDILPSLRDILFTTSLQQEVQTIINTYIQTRYIAMRLDLDIVVRLIDEILDEEEAVAQTLKRISSTKINQACLLTTN